LSKKGAGMLIIKIFNNNALLVRDKHNEEKFVMGKGIGFKKKIGDELPAELIEKEFAFQKPNMKSSLLEIYEQLPSEEIDLVTNLIKEAEIMFQQNYYLSLYVSLEDHIHFAIAKAREGLMIKNPLVWEVKNFILMSLL
jgi:beta-glucoside operon transcriptional antiterminator